MYNFYDSTFPGRLVESRHASSLSGSASSCSATSTTGCARTLYNYNTSAPYLLSTIENIGTTQNSSGSAVAYTYTTTYTFDSLGRLTEVQGPLSGAETTYTYSSSSDTSLYGYLSSANRYTSATSYLTTNIGSRDAFGNATTTTEPDGTLRCRTYDANRNYLTQLRIPMAGQTSCSGSNSADITTSWTRDTWLRLTELQRPDGGCVLNSYDSTGRLYQVKRRDDCNPSTAGDYEQYSYAPDSLISEVDTYDGSGTLTRKAPYTYYQGRQVQEVVNPVNTSYYTGMQYDASGLWTEVDGANSLGKELFAYGPGNDTRVVKDTKYYSSTGSDDWTTLFDFYGDQSQYTDEGSASVTSTRDDMGREVTRTTADSGTTYFAYDAGGDITSRLDGDDITATYTYDLINRPLTVTYSGDLSNACSSSPATVWIYDADGSGSAACPSGMTCSNLAGRLAFVQTSIICDSDYTNNSLNQYTYYAYDANGRTIEEYITDDTGHIAPQLYSWTKDGALSQMTTPSTAVLGWTYGSNYNDSNADLVSGMYHGSASTAIIDSAEWFPFGPLQSYNQENSYSTYGTLRTVLGRNSPIVSVASKWNRKAAATRCLASPSPRMRRGASRRGHILMRQAAFRTHTSFTITRIGCCVRPRTRSRRVQVLERPTSRTITARRGTPMQVTGRSSTDQFREAPHMVTPKPLRSTLAHTRSTMFTRLGALLEGRTCCTMDADFDLETTSKSIPSTPRTQPGHTSTIRAVAYLIFEVSTLMLERRSITTTSPVDMTRKGDAFTNHSTMKVLQ